MDVISRSCEGKGALTGAIWIVPAAGGEARRVRQDPAEVWCDAPAFTADGRGIVHGSNRGGAANLWLQPLDGSQPVRQTSGAGPDRGATIASNGAIAFMNARWRHELILRDVHHDAEDTREAGPGRTLLTHSPYLWAPVFSPDGREIAFSRSDADGIWQIWTIPAAGGVARQITTGTGGAMYPRYTPDGTVIVFHTSAGRRRIARVSRDGGTAIDVGTGEHEDHLGDPSPDGRSCGAIRRSASTSRRWRTVMHDTVMRDTGTRGA